MLTRGPFDIRFREQFDLLSPLKLFGCPSERLSAATPRSGETGTGPVLGPAIMTLIKELLIRRVPACTYSHSREFQRPIKSVLFGSHQYQAT